MLKYKSDVFEKFKAWKTLVKNESEHKMNVLTLDNRGEYLSKTFEAFMTIHGIQHQILAPYALQKNSVVEHANSTRKEIACYIAFIKSHI